MENFGGFTGLPAKMLVPGSNKEKDIFAAFNSPLLPPSCPFGI